MEEESKFLLSKSPGPVYQTTCTLGATPRVPIGRLIVCLWLLWFC